MTLGEIEEMWIEDNSIDLTANLSDEIARTRKLHGKYCRELNISRARHIEEKAVLARLYREKFESFVMPSKKMTFEEQQKSPVGKWEKTSFKEIYLPAEEEFQKQTKKVELLEVKIKFLEQIIREIGQFPSIFREINADRKYMAGG
jgi:hypothetical protein